MTSSAIEQNIQPLPLLDLVETGLFPFMRESNESCIFLSYYAYLYSNMAGIKNAGWKNLD